MDVETTQKNVMAMLATFGAMLLVWGVVEGSAALAVVGMMHLVMAALRLYGLSQSKG